MKVKIKRKKHFKQKYIIMIIAIILIFIGTSYSLLSTTLYINGKANADFNYSLQPVANGSNYSSNTGFRATGGLGIKRDLFKFVKDVKEEKMLTTQIENYEKFYVGFLSSGTYQTTFKINLQNNSPLNLTNGKVEIFEDQTGNYMNPQGNPSLGKTTLDAGEKTTVDVTVSFDKINPVPANSYITYIISYKYNNLNVSYKYRILVVS